MEFKYFCPWDGTRMFPILINGKVQHKCNTCREIHVTDIPFDEFKIGIRNQTEIVEMV